jgi:alpha-L-fucosidase
MKLIALPALALLLLATTLGAQTAAPLTSSVLPPDHPNFNAWRDRRFGMFIHWGPVSIKGTEIGWSRAGERRDRKQTVTKGVPAAEYDNLYKQFNPVKFNADEWAAVAKAAGMKYIAPLQLSTRASIAGANSKA